MLVTWRYRERPGSLIQSFDPRAWWVFYACFLFSTLVFWDFRYLLFFFAIALFFVLTSRITWRESRRAWTFIGFFILFYTTLTFLTGRGGMEVYEQETLITSIQAPFTIFGWTPTIEITVERIFFAISQFLRLFSISSMTILIPYSLNPAHYGVAFHGLGMPDKFAYAMDLTMRFIPTFGRDFQLTLDAQRARGYELEKLSGGLVAQVRKMAPLIIPVIIHALIGSEDIIDAMDLRSFGVGKRSWLEKLTYRKRDFFLIPLGVMILVGSITLSLFGFGKFWVPPGMQEKYAAWVDVPKNRQEAIDLALRECAGAHSTPEEQPAVSVAGLMTWGEAAKYLPTSARQPATFALKDTYWLVVLQGKWVHTGVPVRVEPEKMPVFNRCIMLINIYNGDRRIISD